MNFDNARRLEAFAPGNAEIIAVAHLTSIIIFAKLAPQRHSRHTFEAEPAQSFEPDGDEIKLTDHRAAAGMAASFGVASRQRRLAEMGWGVAEWRVPGASTCRAISGRASLLGRRHHRHLSSASGPNSVKHKR